MEEPFYRVAALEYITALGNTIHPAVASGLTGFEDGARCCDDLFTTVRRWPQ